MKVIVKGNLWLSLGLGSVDLDYRNACMSSGNCLKGGEQDGRTPWKTEGSALLVGM